MIKGAGIWVFGTHNDHNELRHVVYLLQDNCGSFNVLAGKREKKDLLKNVKPSEYKDEIEYKNTAIREAFEESCGMFKFDVNSLNSVCSVNMKCKNGLYVMYSIFLDNIIDVKIYYNNKNIIIKKYLEEKDYLKNNKKSKKNNRYTKFLETVNISAFYLDDFKNKKIDSLRNTNGKLCKIAKRAVEAITSFMEYDVYYMNRKTVQLSIDSENNPYYAVVNQNNVDNIDINIDNIRNYIDQ